MMIPVLSIGFTVGVVRRYGQDERIQLRDLLLGFHVAAKFGRDAVADVFEQRAVLLEIGSAGSCGIFSGSIGVPFFQTR